MVHCAKKVISDSPVLVNLVDGPLGSFLVRLRFLGEIEITEL